MKLGEKKMSDIKSKKNGAKILLWTILFSSSSVLLEGLRNLVLEENRKTVANILVVTALPALMVSFAYFVIKNGDRAEYLIFGRFLTESKIKKES
jgi:hypothetical protein